MPDIRSAIELQDRFSPVIRSIIRANQMAIESFKSTERASKNMIDNDRLNEAIKQLSRAEAGIVDIEESIRQADEKQRQFEESTKRASKYIKDADENQQKFNRSMNGGNSTAGKLLRTVTGIAGAIGAVSLTKEAFSMSDIIAQNEARLSLIVDDGGSVDLLEKLLMNVANETRTSYIDVSANAARFDMLTQEGTFANDEEMLKFTELMNKIFTISGASASEATNAMYQLTQAMASGRLQGDEYRSILENAPLLAKSIESGMRSAGLEGTMKEWASEGLITANVIKNALFIAEDEIEAKFEEMPITWANNWTLAQNSVIETMNPIFDLISQAASSDVVAQIGQSALGELQEAVLWIETHADEIGDVMADVANVAGKAFSILGNGVGFIVNNFETIAPIAKTAAAAIITYNAAVKLSSVYEKLASKVGSARNLIAATSEAIHAKQARTIAQLNLARFTETKTTEGAAAAEGLKTAATLADTAATNAATVATRLWTTALNANPFILAASAIIGVVTAIALFNRETDSASDEIDEIMQRYDEAIERTKSMESSNIAAATSAGLLVDKIEKLAEQEKLTAEETEQVNTIFEKLEDLIPNIANLVPDLTDGFDEQTESLAALAAQLGDTAVSFYEFAVAQARANAYEERISEAEKARIALEEERNEIFMEIARLEATKPSVNWGEVTYINPDNPEEGILYSPDAEAIWEREATDDLIEKYRDRRFEIDQEQARIDKDMQKYADEILNTYQTVAGYGDQFVENDETNDPLGEIINEIGKGNENTDAIKNSLDYSEEDIKYLRDIAERDTINRFTTAEITITQTNTNNINSELDIDGIVNGMYDGLQEATDIAIEGSYQ